MSHRPAAYGTALALALVATQFAVIRLAPSELAVRIALPATIAAVPFALWPYRRRAGVWTIFVGLAANLSVIVANGGLMPIDRHTVVTAVGERQAIRYETGAWIPHSKDVLVQPGEGRLMALRDAVIVRAGDHGFVASAGDIVVWCGLAVLAAEVSWSLQRDRRRKPDEVQREAPAERAKGGAATPG